MRSPARIALFRALQLGDMLCAVPALRALRGRFPRARVTLVGLPWARAFAARFPRYVDEFLAFPGYPGLPEQPVDAAAFARFLADAQSRRFDLTVQMHGDGRRTNVVAALLGAARLCGFAPERDREGLVPYPRSGPEVRRLLAVAACLGAPADDEALEFPLLAEDEAELQAYPQARALAAGGYVCLHPGARAAGKRWPPCAFAAVGDALHREFGLPIVLTGSQQEKGITAEVRAAMRAPAIDMAEPVSVGALARLLAGARLLVCNDTGVSHLACGLGLPSVVVFRATDPVRWGPLDRRLHRVVWDPECRAVSETLREARSLLLDAARAPSPPRSPPPG